MQQSSNTPPPSPFTDEEIRSASPEWRTWFRRVLALAHETGASIELACQAVEETDRTQSTHES